MNISGMIATIDVLVTKPKNLNITKNKENPATNKLRVEFKSTNCKFDNLTAVIIPNIIQRTQPTMGVGMVKKRARTLFSMPTTFIRHPAN